LGGGREGATGPGREGQTGRGNTGHGQQPKDPTSVEKNRDSESSDNNTATNSNKPAVIVERMCSVKVSSNVILLCWNIISVTEFHSVGRAKNGDFSI
jgi:hypothetical protein